MNRLKNTYSLVAAALLAAFTCIATMVIQIPTPTMGYIHMGDSIVILCGVLLGPFLGGMAAGIGSMLADILSGYVIYAVPTLIIKFVSAALAGIVFQKCRSRFLGKTNAAFLLAALLAELNTVCGYFINKIIKTMFLAGVWSREMFGAGIANAFTDFPPNLLQAVTGIVLGFALFPILLKAPGLKKEKQKEGFGQ